MEIQILLTKMRSLNLYIDDASTLEVINLLSIELASYNSKQQIPSNIPDSNQFIPNEHLKSQIYFEKLNCWTEQQQMELNIEKTKTMIFNCTKDKQFTVNLMLKK